MYFLNVKCYDEGKIRQIPYGYRPDAEQACTEYLIHGICAWVSETAEDIEFNNVQTVQSLEEWLVASGDIG
jgi:hypothetical protein